MKCLRISCFLFVSLAVPPNSVTYVVLSIGINVDRRSLKAYTPRRTSQESLLALHISIDSEIEERIHYTFYTKSLKMHV